jgi:TRAP-type C4-dicarboxylate transport system permease large subunit
VYFGIVFVISGVIGLITPPVGSVLTVVASAGKLPIATVNRGVTPFVIALVVVLGLMVAFPALVTAPAAWLARR